MIETTDQVILGGEISFASPKWNLIGKAARDECFKLYIPIDGNAEIILDNEKIAFTKGHIYLFNAKMLQAQQYENKFEHFWIHFIPASLSIRHILFKNFKYSKWPAEQVLGTEELLSGMKKLVEKKTELMKRSDKNTIIRGAIHLADDYFHLKLQAFMIYLMGDVMQNQKIGLTSHEQSTMEKLLPAIEFMDANYLSNPPLERIAETAFMAPSYFHRMFVRWFDLSPHQYMQNKRLFSARLMLLNTDKSIKQIAASCGYASEFYFSKVFKKEYCVTPTKFRNMEFVQ